MATNSSTSTIPVISVGGIALEVCFSDQYMTVLWQVLQQLASAQGYRQASAILEEIERVLGYRPPVQRIDSATVGRVIGYSGEQILQLLDREWYQSSDNEFDILVGYLEKHSVIGHVESFFIWGAGTCRLGDYIASLPCSESVTCTDLSWTLLYFGKLLINNRIDLLPPIMKRERVYYDLDGLANNIVTVHKPSIFCRPRVTDPTKIIYRVKDGFYGGRTDAQAIVLPYLLDSFDSHRATTLLIQICQQLHPGQSILIFVTCATLFLGDPGRNPVEILKILRTLGFAIEYVDLTQLPYTFTYGDFARRRTWWNTLVVRARRMHESGMEYISMISKVDPGSVMWENAAKTKAVLRRGGNTFDLPIGPAAVLCQCAESSNYRQVEKICVEQIGIDGFSSAVGYLTANNLLDLESGNSSSS